MFSLHVTSKCSEKNYKLNAFKKILKFFLCYFFCLPLRYRLVSSTQFEFPYVNLISQKVVCLLIISLKIKTFLRLHIEHRLFKGLICMLISLACMCLSEYFIYKGTKC